MGFSCAWTGFKVGFQFTCVWACLCFFKFSYQCWPMLDLFLLNAAGVLVLKIAKSKTECVQFGIATSCNLFLGYFYHKVPRDRPPPKHRPHLFRGELFNLLKHPKDRPSPKIAPSSMPLKDRGAPSTKMSCSYEHRRYLDFEHKLTGLTSNRERKG